MPFSRATSSNTSSPSLPKTSSLVDRQTMGGGRDWLETGFRFSVAIAQVVVTGYVAYHTTELLKRMMNKNEGVDVAKMKRDLALRLRRPEIEVMNLNGHECKLTQDCIASDDIEVSFDDIGGMEEAVNQINDNIILPMQLARIHKTKGLLSCPTGALLYGRPGTGKTMMAKALAKEAQATFINVKASSIMDKWLGESDKMASAIFSLARKLSPTIIFIDEVDTLLKNRDRGGASTSDAVSTMHGVFLAEWDGLSAATKNDSLVVVLGATNRPQDLDKAYLRRMPVMIQVHPPDLRGRVDILRRLLKNETLDPDLLLEEVAAAADDYTGSDLRELVRTASIRRAKEIMSAGQGSGASAVGSGGVGGLLRAFNKSDFDFALSKSSKTGSAAEDYAWKMQLEHAKGMRKGLQTLKDLLAEAPAAGGVDNGNGNGRASQSGSEGGELLDEDVL